ncbi:MAG TPA: hypothetical protein VG317_09120 [Pseudonocardiaceae bacterium]|jgi:4-hydroxy-3-methylbut-2-enyl diphosphate reductase|nr:hypothetical protein [Pseudonocardiaceae bacterium]
MVEVPDLLVAAPLWVEARAIRRGLPAGSADISVVRTGMGRVRSARAVPGLVARRPAALAVAGVAGALTSDLTPGDVVVASEVRSTDRAASPVATTKPEMLAAALRSAGLKVHIGHIVSADHVVRGRERAELAATGALVVDMESAWLAEAASAVPFAVVRVVVDTPERPLAHPATVVGGWTALRMLARAGPALSKWSTWAESVHTVPKEVRP